MKITIEVIPHDQQRYPTVGDWYWEGEDLVIKVSKLSDWRRECLIAVHELVEVLICKQDGVDQKTVDEFDMNFEANREPDNENEPGDEPNAPYSKQHCIATGVERVLAASLGVNWKDYERELNDLP